MKKPSSFLTSFSRRRFIASTTAVAYLSSLAPSNGSQPTKRKKVAGVVTIYRKNSHADVLLGKILEGWKQDGGPGPNLQLVSMYVDQFPHDDLSMDLAKKFGVRLCRSIKECLELDTEMLAVDGVLSIGEHGDYPVNQFGQQLYPRRRFFSEICDVFEQRRQVVPVFNDKHPGPVWEDAQWMYERAKGLGIPWMAGSSLTVGTRDPDVTLTPGSRLQSCVAVGYSGLDVYGFHTLDFLQCIIERRQTPNQGVASVQGLPISHLDTLLQNQTIDLGLLDLALRSSGTDLAAVKSSSINLDPKNAAIFLVRYRDGLIAPVIMLASQSTGISVACRSVDGKSFATRAEERPEPRYPHFAYLLKGIELMIETGKPSYPVERSILAAGILDRALVSLNRGGEILDTPELNLSYDFIDYPHAPHVSL